MQYVTLSSYLSKREEQSEVAVDAILLLKFPIKGDQLINTSQLQVQGLGLVVQYIVDAVSGNKLHLTTSTRYVEHLV